MIIENLPEAQVSRITSEVVLQAWQPLSQRKDISYFQLFSLLSKSVPVELQLFCGFRSRLTGQDMLQFHIQFFLFLQNRQLYKNFPFYYSSSTTCSEINRTEKCNSTKKIFAETNLPVCQSFLASHKVFKVVVIAVGELIKGNIQLVRTTNEILLNTVISEHTLPQRT